MKNLPDAYPFSESTFGLFSSFQLHFFLLPVVNTFPDSAWYLSNALNIFNGYGYVDTDHLTPIISRGRPVFPFLISLSFWLFGVSIHSAMLVIRLFFVLNNLIVYKLGKDLFDWKVGFLAAMLCLFSSTIHEWSSHLIYDNVWPFFILVSLWLIFKACSQRKVFWFILAGISLAICFMTKELALLWLPLPLIYVLVFQSTHRRQNLRGVTLLYLAFFLCMMPWAIHVYEYSETLKVLLGGFGHREMSGNGRLGEVFRECKGQGIGAILCKLQIVSSGMIAFYQKYIVKKFAHTRQYPLDCLCCYVFQGFVL